MRKILLVEDEELILQGVRNIIDWEKHQMEVVFMAHNGQEALDFLSSESVDIIISDIHMPVMDGLSFMQELRKKDKRVRCIFLTGYDEFEYARKAILLDVEDYILKPIDEEKLESAVLLADEKLKVEDCKTTGDIEVNTNWIRFLSGSLSEDENVSYISMLPELSADSYVYPALMKIKLTTLKEHNLTDILSVLQKESENIRIIYLASDMLFLLCLALDESEDEVYAKLQTLQNSIESHFGILTFISMGGSVDSYERLPLAYEEAKRFQKYRIIEGYGACICPSRIHHRTSADMVMDNTFLRKAIFQKNKEEALNYIEDLFINNIKTDVSIDQIYRVALEIAMLLEDIKSEYQLKNRSSMHNLTEIMEEIYQAEDLFTLKTLFIGEIIEIIVCLSEEHSQYTPVVKQILAEVSNHYQEDMNLKTLSYKYHMNASYLGQIFQKEVGCSFAQHLSNTKNSIAKDMILNTNMRINDIAKAVGYPDTSYFYRKFKQCYGVSPASLREMKNY